MQRFAHLLANGLKGRGVTVEVLNPPGIAGRFNGNFGKAVSKWLGYVDKWILFPAVLRRTVSKKRQQFGDRVRYHICDHSNAPYLGQLPRSRTVVTCHDVLAIRGALGYPAAYCPASRTGILLQRWILKHLRRAQRVACVSHLTLEHLCEVAGNPSPGNGWKVVPNALNGHFEPIESGEAARILEHHGYLLPRPFLLHVGSNLPRKNRRMLLQMIQQGKQPWPGSICFAGEPMDRQLAENARILGIAGRVHCVPKPDHKTLCALYSLAHALIFPSFSEGFGWPVIEAQACGAPVIASDLEPLPEVSGGAALHADPHSAQAFACALLTLSSVTVRKSLIERGLKNAARFDLSSMIDRYLALHQLDDSPVAKVTL